MFNGKPHEEKEGVEKAKPPGGGFATQTLAWAGYASIMAYGWDKVKGKSQISVAVLLVMGSDNHRNGQKRLECEVIFMDKEAV